jgi:hypothetical protein
MKVVVLTHSTHGIVAVVENPDGCMSKGAVALAWAKSEGYSTLPENVTISEAKLVSYGIVQRKLTPCHELEELDEAGRAIE